jgi:hypothetical protein
MNDLQAFGNPNEALQLFYEKAIGSAVATAGIDEGELRSWFETYLITPAGTRGLVFHGRETTGGIPNKIVDVLEAQHLIRPKVRSGSRWYELTHDRFIRPIQISNLEWKSDQWSSSFEAKYAAAIRKAVTETSISETALRKFLDSMVTSRGTRLARAAESIPESAVAVLVREGLLRKDTQGVHHVYTPLHDTIAQAIQQANQNWWALNWSGARSLRQLESRARQWARDVSAKESLLLTRAELPGAEEILRSAKVSGIGFSQLLQHLVEASRRAERTRSLRLLFLIAVSLLAIIVVDSTTGAFGMCLSKGE